MVPEEAYSSSYLREEPLDKSYDFISQCASQGYHVRWAGGRARGRGWAGTGQGAQGKGGGLEQGGRGSGPGADLTTCFSPQPHQLVPVLS